MLRIRMLSGEEVALEGVNFALPSYSFDIFSLGVLWLQLLVGMSAGREVLLQLSKADSWPTAGKRLVGLMSEPAFRILGRCLAGPVSFRPRPSEVVSTLAPGSLKPSVALPDPAVPVLRPSPQPIAIPSEPETPPKRRGHGSLHFSPRRDAKKASPRFYRSWEPQEDGSPATGGGAPPSVELTPPPLNAPVPDETPPPPFASLAGAEAALQQMAIEVWDLISGLQDTKQEQRPFRKRRAGPSESCLQLGERAKKILMEVSQAQVDGLAAAAGQGRLAEVESMLQLPLDPDLRASYGFRPLGSAAYEAWIVKGITFSAGAAPGGTSAGSDGGTPLMMASGRGHIELVRLLLAAGAEKDPVNVDSGNTALMNASEHGRVDVVHLLLEARADVNVKDPCGCSGHTASILAAMQPHVKVLQLLLEAGADKNLADDNGCTALMAASFKGHVEAVRLLLHVGARQDLADDSGMTALMLAAGGCHVEVLRSLLEAGADLSLVDAAFIVALGRRHFEAFRLLLNAGANKDLADASGRTALMLAAEQCQLELLRLLLEAGADKNLADNNGCTALMMARTVEAMRLLLDAGASTDLVDNMGNTALVVASSKGHVERVRLLLDAGAKKDVANDTGSTALSMAISQGHSQVELLLREGVADK
eukprot:s2535_g3.t1